jgi:RNA polymerase sigma-70 factor (ECF subfamily)
VQGAGSAPRTEIDRQRKVVDEFLAALRAGDFEGLVAVLDPDVFVRIDEAAARPGAPREIRGARNWARGAITFAHMVRFVQPALINGAVGLVWAPRGRLFRALSFTIKDGRIAQVDVIADPGRLRNLQLAVLKN